MAANLHATAGRGLLLPRRCHILFKKTLFISLLFYVITLFIFLNNVIVIEASPPRFYPFKDHPNILKSIVAIDEAFEETIGSLLRLDPISLYIDASQYVEIFLLCMAAGGNERSCGLRTGLCFIYGEFLVDVFGDIIPGFSSLAWNTLCSGEPPLKCCQTLDGCHTAFNDYEPINCEMNPSNVYRSPSTAGVCIPDDLFDLCTCNYLAPCYIPVVRALSPSPFEEYNDPVFHVARMDGYFGRVSSFIGECTLGQDNLFLHGASIETKGNQTYYSIPSTACRDVLDFVRYLGCNSFIENTVLMQTDLNNQTFEPVNVFGEPVVRENDIVDQLPIKRRQLPYYAVARLSIDIPQFWLRIDYIYGHIWTEESRTKMLVDANIVNAEEELLNYVDYGGLQLLKYTLLENWPLILVPVNESLWDFDQLNSTSTTDIEHSTLKQCKKDNGRGHAVYLDGFSIMLLPDGKSVSINIKVFSSNILPRNVVFVRTYWDDEDALMDTSVLDQTNITLSFEQRHLYSSCGTKYIMIQLTNESGLRTVVRGDVEIQCDSATSPSSTPTVDYPNVLSVEIDIVIDKIGDGVAGKQVAYFEASSLPYLNDDSLRRENFIGLGSFSSELVNSTITTTVNLDWNADPLHSIMLTCRALENDLETRGVISIGQVRLRTVFGNLISVPFLPLFDSITKLEGPLFCARRGNVIEDDQVVGVLRLGSALDGEIIENPGNVPADATFYNTGIYLEDIPGRFAYYQTVEDVKHATEGGGGTIPSTTVPSPINYPSPSIVPTTSAQSLMPINTDTPSTSPEMSATSAANTLSGHFVLVTGICFSICCWW